MPLQFVRPALLWWWLALPIVGLLWHWGRTRMPTWLARIDPALRGFVIERGDAAARKWSWLWPVTGFALAVGVLAGPAWREVPQTQVQAARPQVLLVPMSRSVLDTDLPPSRLARLRAKVRQNLQLHGDVPQALIVYAGTAHLVSPLTDDPANIEIFLDDLNPAIMPEPGDAPDAALRLARTMLSESGERSADVVLFASEGDSGAATEAAALRRAGHSVSVIGVGPGVHARLRTVAQAGGGFFSRMQLDSRDLAMLDQSGAAQADPHRAGARKGGKALEDGGAWWVPVLMLWLLPAFRRALPVIALALSGLLLTMPQPAVAGDLWRRADQREHARLQQGNAAYRAGRFDDAVKAYEGNPSAEAQYNLGNALAKAGRLQEAIAAYDRALATLPTHADALANRETVRRAQQRKPPTGQDRQQNRSKPGPSGAQSQPRANNPRNTADSSKGGQSSQGNDPGQSGAARPADREAQARADAAQRARMDSARAQQAASPASPTPDGDRSARETPEMRSRRLRNEAALRRIPDDPGTLLQRRFLLEAREGKGR